MKDINKIYQDCAEMVRAAGYDFPEPVEVKANTRAKTRWGCVKWSRIPDGFSWYWSPRALELSSRLLADDVDDWPTYNTMLHEIIHLVAGCAEKHGARWQAIADDISSRYGYKITRTNNYSEFIKPAPAKYRATCKTCGRVFYRDRYREGCEYFHTGCGTLTAWAANIQEPEPVAVKPGTKTVIFGGKEYAVANF